MCWKVKTFEYREQVESWKLCSNLSFENNPDKEQKSEIKRECRCKWHCEDVETLRNRIAKPLQSRCSTSYWRGAFSFIMQELSEENSIFPIKVQEPLLLRMNKRRKKALIGLLKYINTGKAFYKRNKQVSLFSYGKRIIITGRLGFPLLNYNSLIRHTPAPRKVTLKAKDSKPLCEFGTIELTGDKKKTNLKYNGRSRLHTTNKCRSWKVNFNFRIIYD